MLKFCGYYLEFKNKVSNLFPILRTKMQEQEICVLTDCDIRNVCFFVRFEGEI